MTTDNSNERPMKNCRCCKTMFAPTPAQVRKSDFLCRQCRNTRQRARLASQKAAGVFDYERGRRQCQEWRERNLEAQRERERQRHARDRPKSRAKALAYQKANARKVCQRVVERERHVRRATPRWANRQAIATIYLSCPSGHHVDHIIPLRGRTVCGLHVENNLQHLPALENNKKGNSFSG